MRRLMLTVLTVGTLAALLAGTAPAYGHPGDRWRLGAPAYVFTVASVQWDGAMDENFRDSHTEVRVAHRSQQSGTAELTPGGGGSVGGVTVRALRVPFTFTGSGCTETALAEISIHVDFRRTGATVRARLPDVPWFGQHTNYYGYPLFSGCAFGAASQFDGYANPTRGGDLHSTTARVPIARLRGRAPTIEFDYHRSFSDQGDTVDGRWHIVVGLRRVRTCIVGRPGFTRCLRGR